MDDLILLSKTVATTFVYILVLKYSASNRLIDVVHMIQIERYFDSGNGRNVECVE